jgi:hypothetical protein
VIEGRCISRYEQRCVGEDHICHIDSVIISAERCEQGKRCAVGTGSSATETKVVIPRSQAITGHGFAAGTGT